MVSGRLTINVDGMINWVATDSKMLRKEFDVIAQDIEREGVKIMKEEVPHGSSHKLEDSVGSEVAKTKTGGTIKIFADTPYSAIIDGDGKTDAHTITPKSKKVLKFEGSSPRHQVLHEALKHPKVRIEGQIFRIHPAAARYATLYTPIKEGRLPKGKPGAFYPAKHGSGKIIIRKGLQPKAWREEVTRHELWHATEHAARIPYIGERSEREAGFRALAAGLDTTVFAHSVNHPGSKQTPFTANALKRLKEYVNERIGRLQHV